MERVFHYRKKSSAQNDITSGYNFHIQSESILYHCIQTKLYCIFQYIKLCSTILNFFHVLLFYIEFCIQIKVYKVEYLEFSIKS